MSARSLFAPKPLVAIWTGVCALLLIVGRVTFPSSPTGNGDLVGAVASPSVSGGAVLAVTAVLWLAGLGVMLAATALRRVAAGRSAGRA